MIDPTFTTLTVALAAGTFGPVLVAAMVVWPVALVVVTGTVAVVALPAKDTLAGTVATVVLLEFRLTTRPVDGAAVERVRFRFDVVFVPIAYDVDEKVIVAPTCTCRRATGNPVAEAVNVVDPKLTPFTVGCEAGAVLPWAMNTVGDETVAADVLLLASEMVTPPDGAGPARLTCSVADWLGPMMAGPCKLSWPRLPTVTRLEELP